MDSNLERQARWYALKLILIYFSIIAAFAVIAYIDVFWPFVVVVAMFALIIAGGIYRDAYNDKLMELEKNERTNSRTC